MSAGGSYCDELIQYSVCHRGLPPARPAAIEVPCSAGGGRGLLQMVGRWLPLAIIQFAAVPRGNWFADRYADTVM